MFFLPNILRARKEVRNGDPNSATVHFTLSNTVGHCSIFSDQVEAVANEINACRKVGHIFAYHLGIPQQQQADADV